ncbi:MAG: aldo/keto reductase, partial [Coriobacteriales bacterium]|nr:aldo/keto reductase [Coriobacteriales bacterium]
MKDALSNTAKLGFGCMRLPLLDPNDQKSIDIEEFKKMVDAFIAGGGTYFDTAFVYHNGKSEVALNEALVQRYPRESFTIATKTLSWICKSEQAAKQNLPTSLNRLGTDYIDFYLMHNVNAKNAQVFKDFKMWDYMQQAKAEGKVRNIGFSLHDNKECLLDLLKMFPNPDFVQVQVNYLDWQNKLTDSKRLVKTLQEKEIPIVIMEPARGGNLINLPDRALKVLQDKAPKLTPAQLAYGFCLDIPGVLTVLSGASNLNQIT